MTNEDDSNDDNRLWGLAGFFGLTGLSVTASDRRLPRDSTIRTTTSR